METRRLLLRRLTMADVDDLAELEADPEVMRYITGGVPTPREKIEHVFLPAQLGLYPAGFGGRAAVEKSTGEFLGWFRFDPGPPGEIALGFRLRRSAWGQGYATEGLRALIRDGFTERGAQYVIAQTMAVNLASRRVLEKAGLTLVRIFHQPWPWPVGGREHGDAEYALDKTGWTGQGRAQTAPMLHRCRSGDIDAPSTSFPSGPRSRTGAS
jgi:RimJ/RimL family protein N-acetyltransferase